MPDVGFGDINWALSLGGLIAGVIVGLTGMGGAALVTPMLVLLFGINPAAAVSSDVVASAFMKPVGSYVHIREKTVHWGLVGVRLIDRRADLLTATEIVEDAAIDPYSFVRDAYLQRRQSLVHDGHPPTDTSQPDFWDEVEF